MSILIAPSLLSCDMTRLGEEVQAVMDAGADMIHFDVMDHHYVPNLTLGPFVCASITERFTNIALDVHLMAKPVDALITAFAKARAKRISIHEDATLHLDRSLALIKELGAKAGLALNPSTPPYSLEWCRHRLDFVLIMTVNPGFGGQKWIPAVVKKIEYINKNYPDLPICVDGGVTIDNIGALFQAGATEFVAGSTIFQSVDYKATIARMRKAAA